MIEVPREVRDFCRAGRCFAEGDPEGALVSLLPCGPREDKLPERVRCMVAIGAVLSGLRGAASAGEEFADRLVAAGAELDSDALAELITTHSATELVDVLVELVARFVAAIGRPPVEVAPCDTPGGRPVLEETPAGCRLSGPPASGLAPGGQPVPPTEQSGATGVHSWVWTRRRGWCGS